MLVKYVRIHLLSMRGRKLNIKELYIKLGGDYEDVVDRFIKEELVKKFVLKFPADNTFDGLKEALERGDLTEAFRFIHTLKGISANLGFAGLYQAASELTEQLRGCNVPADEKLVAAVIWEYEKVISAIKELD